LPESINQQPSPFSMWLEKCERNWTLPTVVGLSAPVRIKGPDGPSSNSQPSCSASGLAMRVRGFVKTASTGVMRPSSRRSPERSGASPSRATTGTGSTETPRVLSSVSCSRPYVSTALVKRVTSSLQSGRSIAVSKARSLVASAPRRRPATSYPWQ
jgi:hypothetical protein